MKTTINQSDFVSAFKGNSERKNQFSYDALCALFNYYEQMEQDTGEEMELDVIAICCDWAEYAIASEAANAYGWETSEPTEDYDEAIEKAALDYLNNKTQVIQVNLNSVLVLNF
jgi:hypothetical protein